MRWFSNRNGRFWLVVMVACAGVVSGVACQKGADALDAWVGACDAHCEAHTCGLSDGCGGVCACAGDEACGADNRCVDAAACTETCVSRSYVCGSVCGQACGACADGNVCARGECVAAKMPRSANDVSCVGCTLSLKRVQQQTRNRDIGQVTLALEYLGRDGASAARMGDFQIETDKPVVLVSAVEGDALQDAGKSLYVDPTTKLPWDARADGVYRFVALSLNNSFYWQSGRLITLTYYVPHPDFVTFRLIRRMGILSPADADRALQSQGFDQPVVVVRR